MNIYWQCFDCLTGAVCLQITLRALSALLLREGGWRSSVEMRNHSLKVLHALSQSQNRVGTHFVCPPTPLLARPGRDCMTCAKP
jgi:hypothetical protein